MIRLKFFCILLVLPCLALQCNKDKDDPDPDNGNNNNKEQLPPATQSGENTFGCLVNGKVWRPKVEEISKDPINSGYGRGELLVTAQKELNENSGIDQSITIHIPKGGYEIKNHLINSSEYPNNYAYFRNKKCKYITDSLNTGYLKLTRLDSIENIVSGRFEFTAVNDSCGELDTIRVTKGRFDIKYAH